MNIKIIKYIPGETPNFKRYTSSKPVPCYTDITQLWVLQNNVVDKFLIKIKLKGWRKWKKFWITLKAFAGLITDKASTPIASSDWYPARLAYLWHDILFSTHCFRQFAEYGDDGFRASNMFFRKIIDLYIKRSFKYKIISKLRAFFWHIKKRIWWRSVGSIVGQGLYVNGSPKRGYHGKFSACEIERVM
jgi:hypothetical protein